MNQLPKNAKLFIWFRVLFNCRFYYPVLAIFFIDLGLSISQYILLNAIWAIAIVLLEVPSGALADLVGRKRLLVGAAWVMIMEMALLVFAPVGAGNWLFAVCALNRILAGMAEAAASGADEALAYDSLHGEKKDLIWDEVLAKMGRRQALCMAVATLVGAAVYDVALMEQVTTGLNIPTLKATWVIKIPVTLCLIQGLGALCIALQMKDVDFTKQKQSPKWKDLSKQALKAGSWLIRYKLSLFLVLGGLSIDVFVRNFATLMSKFYRLLDYPEFSFGFFGFIVSIAGFGVPYIAKRTVRKFGLAGNMALAFLFTLSGLIALAFLRGPLGILGVVIAMMSIGFSSFIGSKFLNQMVPSKDRATVLSVKGLIFNLGYAGFSFLYAAALKQQVERSPLIIEEEKNDIAFENLLVMTPIAFLVVAMIYWAFSRIVLLRPQAE